METTLNKIRENGPCADGWAKLLRTLGKTQTDNEPLPIITILDSNGLDDALWCLRAVKNRNKKIRLYMVWCARQVQHLMTSQQSLDALDVAERFANGEATQKELAAAGTVAGTAAFYVARGSAIGDAVAFNAARAAAWATVLEPAGPLWNSAGIDLETKLREICAECTREE